MDSNAAVNALTGIRQSPPLQGTASAANAIARVSYTHDALIDLIITNPMLSQGALAKHFGYTQAWLSRVMNSDAFQARLAQRKSDIVDPTIALSIDEKLRAVASLSLDVVLDKLQLTQNPDLAVKVMEISTKAMGYGARAQNVAVQQNFVVAMPTKVDDPEAWSKKYQNFGAGQVADAKVVGE